MLYRNLIVITLLLITSCGFKPIYSNQFNEKLASIKIGHIATLKPTKESLELKTALEKEFNPQGVDVTKKYTLDIDYKIQSELSVVQQDTITTSKIVKIILNYNLKDTNGREVTKGKITQVENYDVSNSPFSDYVLNEELNIKIIKSLSYRLRNDLLQTDFN